jgi:hypothetical protein
MNIYPEQLQLIEAHRPQITRILVGIFPALALTGTMLAAWLNILGALLFGKEPGSWFDFGDLSSWKAPEKLVWLLILGGALVLLVPGVWGHDRMNLVILCSLIYFSKGAIVSCLFKRGGSGRLRWLFYVILACSSTWRSWWSPSVFSTSGSISGGGSAGSTLRPIHGALPEAGAPFDEGGRHEGHFEAAYRNARQGRDTVKVATVTPATTSSRRPRRGSERAEPQDLRTEKSAS